MARARGKNATPELDNNLEDTMSDTDTDILTEEPDVDVEEVDEPDIEQEDVEEVAKEEKGATEPAKPKRGEVPEGYVTPIQFAKILGEKGLHTNKAGEVVKDVKPQMVYSYMRNSPQDDRLEPQEIEDSNGVTRSVLKLDEALEWWERKNARAAERKQNAKAREEKKANAAKTSKQAAEETGETPAGLEEPAEEAE